MPANQGRRSALVASALAMLAIPTVAVAQTGLPTVDPTVPAARDTEPVILTGQSFPAWSVPSNRNAKAPLTDLTGEPGEYLEDPAPHYCFALAGVGECEHNHYQDPDAETAGVQPPGTPTDRLLGYRWDPEDGEFVQIPFQVDEVFTRYLDNSASEFSTYSGEDQHTTYAYDREGFRFTANDPSDPCGPVPAVDPASDDPQPGGPPTTPDPVSGLDDNDEIVFMASDAGPAAPPDATLPEGINSARAVAVTDPLTGAVTFAYVMRAAEDGPGPAYDADNGYVRYDRDDPAADRFEFSESSYEGYGKAPSGPYCDKAGNLVTNPDGSPKIGQRRPGDYATISTDRYRFRYDGRWLMTGISVSPGDDGLSGDGSYGADLVDRWKARAFQQDPGSNTPCCGYEEEDTNWGGSGQLLGERRGPVRAIRETWGADSGTNVIRRETFYGSEMRQKTWLRVHVIPPLDGIYAQWDFNAGIVNRYFNPKVPAGVPVDGKNDEAIGNFDDPCNSKYDANDTSDIDQMYRETYREVFPCPLPPDDTHLSIDVTDPTLQTVNAGLDWNEITGPNGTIVDRYQIDEVTDVTPGGAAQQLAAFPYYRDDSCFDDGTGSDPGLELHPRGDEPTEWEGQPRKCWDSATDDPVPGGNPRYFQGDIGTHGLHLLFQAESDNARLTVPITEIVSEQRMVMLPGGDNGSAGEAYGRGFEKPLVASVAGPIPGNSAPSSEFSFNPTAPSTGDAVTLDASASSDSDAVSVGDNEVPVGGINRYEWDLDGDGVYETDGGSSPQLSHTFTRPGTYEVGLRVTDNLGATDTISHPVTVANRGPTAAIAFSPDSPLTGDEVSFDGSGSSDPDGQISRYEWDLDGDGTFETDAGTTPTASRSFDDPGTYEVSLRVTDDSGASATATRSVTVANRPPTAAIAFSPGSPSTGEQVIFDGSGSSDPDGHVARYEWDLDGDGSFETDTGAIPTTSHSFNRPGTHEVGLRVTDDLGAADEETVDVEVANRGPAAAVTMSPPSPATGEDVTFDGSTSSDPDGQIGRYEWDLDGDGEFETDTGTTPTATRSFDRPGTYQVSLRVTDDSGATDEAAVEFQVANRIPTAAITLSPDSPTTEDTVTFDGSGSSDPDGEIDRYEWDLDDDGIFETDTGTEPTASRSFDDPGAYEVSLRVTDDSGASSQATVQFQVSNPPPEPTGNPDPGSGQAGGGGPAMPRANGFRLDLRRSGKASLSYTARLSVEGVLELRLIGVRDGSRRALAQQQATTERPGDVVIGGRLNRVARRCRGYDSCRLVAHASVTSVATLLFDETKRIRL